MFSDPQTQRLWHAGKIRAAYEHSASTQVTAVASEHPFRDANASLEQARRWHEHGMLCFHVAQFAECHTMLERAHAARVRMLGAEHPDALETLERRAALAHYRLAADAPAKFEDVVKRLVRALGEDHGRVAIARRNQAACLRDTGELAEARRVLELARPAIEGAWPTAHAEAIALDKVDALLAVLEDRAADAIPIAERAIRTGTAVWHDTHPFVAAAEMTLAAAELELDEAKRAAKRMSAVRKVFQNVYGRCHPLLAIADHYYARCELVLGRNFELAEMLASGAINLYRETYPAAPVAFSHTLFDILYESRRVVDAGELALELEDAPRWLQLEMTSKVANHLVAMRDFRAALRFVKRTRDLCDEDELRAKWTDQLAYLTEQLPPGPDRDT